MRWETEFKIHVLKAPGDTLSKKLEYVTDYLQKMVEEEKEKQASKNKSNFNLDDKLRDIHNSMVRDFNSNQNRKCHWTTCIRGVTHYHYSFNNGDLMDFDDNGVFLYTNRGMTYRYTLSDAIKAKFINTMNSINSKQKQQQQKQNGGWEDYFKTYAHFHDENEDPEDQFWKEFEKKYGSGSFTGSSTSSSTSSNRNHPKRSVYDALLSTIKSRKEHLATLANNHPDRISLQNELDVAIGRAEDMKKKYNF